MSALLSFYGAIVIGVSILWGLLSFLFTGKTQRWSFFSIGFGILLSVTPLFLPITGEASSENYGTAMIAGVCAILLLLAFYSCRFLKRKRAANQQEQEHQIMQGTIPAFTCNTQHIFGLPIPSGVPCQVIVQGKSVILKSDASTYSIPMSRIMRAREYPETEMRQYIESNLGRSIMGGLTFGPTGAIVGAMPETKYRRRIFKWNTMISYMSKEQSPQIIILTDTKPMTQLTTSINKYACGQTHLTETDPIEL